MYIKNIDPFVTPTRPFIHSFICVSVFINNKYPYSYDTFIRLSIS